MKRMEGASRDEVSANVEALKKVFPAVVKEGKVDMDALKTILGCEVATDTGCYRMTWNGKEAARQFALKRSHGTLLPDRGSSRDWETTQNVYIEGDNLEVLKLLQGGYYKSVKMIYIDPPYNTGKDFVYHDNFHDSIENYKKLTGQVNAEGAKLKTNVETSGRYHTDWLNMMFPRLMLARNLLRDDGVIFISIDDNEIINLRKVADDIFGEDNFIGQITVLSNPRGRDYGGIAKVHEFVVVYGKTPDADLSLITDPNSGFRLFDSRGGFELRELRNRNVKFNKENRPNLYYPFYVNTETQDENGLFEISLDAVPGWLELYPLQSQGVDVVWRWGKEKSKANLNLEIAARKKRDGGYMIVEKYRESKKMARSMWVDKDVNTERGTIEVKGLFDDAKVFDYPKPVSMLNKMIEMATGDDEEFLVLDFFSGSGSLAHALMQQNAADSAKRRYIMVQLPEPTYEIKDGQKKALKGSKAAFVAGLENICEIGKERIRRAGDKVMAEWTVRQNDAASQLALDGTADATKSVPPDIGFRVFKLDTSNFVDWNPNSEDLTGDLLKAKDNVLVGRTKEDILYEVIVKCNFRLTDKIVEHKVGNNTVYAVRKGELMVCIDDQIPLEVGDEMLRLKYEVYGNPESFRVVFLDNGLSDDSKANIVQRLKGDGMDETCIRCV